MIVVLQLHGSKKVESGSIRVFVTRELNIQLQAVNNVEAMSDRSRDKCF